MKKAQKLEKISDRLFTEITSRQGQLVGGGATLMISESGPDQQDTVEDW